jgi:membrane-associated phospholipid phosphatase
MSKQPKIKKAGRKVVEADTDVVEAAAAHKDSAPVRLISYASKVGDQPPLRAISAAAILGGLIGGNRRLLRTGVRMLIALEAATALKDAIKTRVDRIRPRSADSQAQRKIKPGKRTDKEATSFPSGHSAGSMAVARVVGREFPEYGAAAITAAAAVGAAQVPRYSHYATDVAAGFVVGLVAEAATDVVWRGLFRDEDQQELPVSPMPLPDAPLAAS